MRTRFICLLCAGLAAMSAAAQEPREEGGFSMERVLEEIEHQSNALREWVTDRIAEARREHFPEPAEPIGRNVTLTFTLAGEDEALTLMTAQEAYRVDGFWSGTESESELQQRTRTHEYMLEIEGRVEPLDEGGRFLVTCRGVMEAHSHTEGPGMPGPREEFVLRFSTSAQVAPGSTQTLIKRGEQELKLTLETE